MRNTKLNLCVSRFDNTTVIRESEFTIYIYYTLLRYIFASNTKNYNWHKCFVFTASIMHELNYFLFLAGQCYEMHNIQCINRILKIKLNLTGYYKFERNDLYF